MILNLCKSVVNTKVKYFTLQNKMFRKIKDSFEKKK